MTQTERRLIKATAQAVGWLMIDARMGFGDVNLGHVEDYDRAKAYLFAAIRDMDGAIDHADDAAFMQSESTVRADGPGAIADVVDRIVGRDEGGS